MTLWLFLLVTPALAFLAMLVVLLPYRRFRGGKTPQKPVKQQYALSRAMWARILEKR